ncbi:MAG TPA: membrane protein insertase YidC, partial [Steroidobacteraceae bacterium]|nr:membrane protein insertase YidC [Steroidobacteraceae bacterium]
AVAQPSATADLLPPLPSSGATSAPAVPNADAPPPIATPAPAATPAAANPAAQRITVRTDVYNIELSTQGGELLRAELVKYPLDKDQPGKQVVLLDNTSDRYFYARSGLRSADEKSAPTHQALYQAEASSFQLQDGQDTLSVPLVWTNGGVTVTKMYTFKRGSYAIDLKYLIDNKSANEWSAASYVQLARNQPVVESSMLHAESYAYFGPAVYTGQKIQKLKLTDEDYKNFTATYTDGWIASMQHHFVVASLPDVGKSYDFRLNIDTPQQFTLMYRGPLVPIAAGASGELHETLFIGPKLQSHLTAIRDRLDLVADYGWLHTVAKPLFIVLNAVHSYIGNWGWSIILVTLLIKALFYKLTASSGKSMAKMREMAPRLKAMQDRYKDDREALGRATMEFYKREKINPLASCLPTLVQMPIWMAFYWVILNSAEMRQAPFIGYLTDLSSKDPYFILPIILGVANFMQFRLNPAPADPVQAKVMMLMPVLMTGMMAFFPSGLALYWITNTGLSILQQWHINRTVAAETATAKKT